MRIADREDIAALELLAVELDLARAVSVVPKMPPAAERPAADGLVVCSGEAGLGYAADAGHLLAHRGSSVVVTEAVPPLCEDARSVEPDVDFDRA
jgi:hypothetical protein